MANYTTNLNLLKKDPETDGNDYFNIETMLNDNWDKIDAGVAAKETPAGAQGKVDNLAGTGRTTETVKSNADAITALNQTVTSHLADITSLQNEVKNSVPAGTFNLSTSSPVTSFDAKVGGGVAFEMEASPLLVNLTGSDGDFEVDSNGDGLADGWVTVNHNATSLDNTNKLYGAYSQKINPLAARGSSNPIEVAKELNINNGNKIYFFANIKTSDYTKFGNLVLSKFIPGGWTGGISLKMQSVSNNNWNRISCIFDWDTTKSKIGAGIFGNGTNTTDDYINIDGVMTTDLTSIFGAGSEPDQAWCDANIKYVNGIQPMSNLYLESSGKNLIDNSVDNWEQGSITAVNGQFTDSNANIRAKKPCLLAASKTYTMTIATGYQLAIAEYTVQGQFIRDLYWLNNGYHYIPSETMGHVLFVARKSDASVITSAEILKMNIQLEEDSVATSYELHKGAGLLIEGYWGGIGAYRDRLSLRNGKAVKLGNIKRHILQASDINNINTTYPNIDAVRILKTKLPNSAPWTIAVEGKVVVPSLFNKEIANTAEAFNTETGYAFSTSVTDLALIVPKGTYANLAAAQAALAGTEIWYVLAQTEIETLNTPINGLSAHQGKTTVSLQTGIVKEKANPYLYNAFYRINYVEYPTSLLSCAVSYIKKIIRVKDGKEYDDTANWTIAETTGDGGTKRAYIAQATYESGERTGSRYYTIYEVLHENHDSQQALFTAQYKQNLKDGYNQLAETASEQENKISNLSLEIKDNTDKLTKIPIAFTPATGISIITQKCYIENKRLYVSVTLKKTDDTPFAQINRITLGTFANITFTKWQDTICTAYNNVDYASASFSLKAQGNNDRNILYAESLSAADIKILSLHTYFFIV